MYKIAFHPIYSINGSEIVIRTANDLGEAIELLLGRHAIAFVIWKDAEIIAKGGEDVSDLLAINGVTHAF